MSTGSGCRWDLLPSVILIEILSYLPLKDRINACSTCKAWRNGLFHPMFWRNIVFKFHSNNIYQTDKSLFLASWAAKRLRSCAVYFDSINGCCLSEVDNVLLKLSRNAQLEELLLFPSHCHMNAKGNDNELQFHQNNNNNERSSYIKYSSCIFASSCSIVESLKNIICHCRSLRCLTLGCLEDLMEQSEVFLQLLKKYQGSAVTTLGLASMKSDPNTYALLDITPDYFVHFTNLQVLSIDYDYMSDRLLSVLSSTYNTPLLQLVLHIHGIDITHPGTTEYVWYTFRQHKYDFYSLGSLLFIYLCFSTQCSLIMNLIHSYDGMQSLDTDLLRPSMPLTHFRSFFSASINIRAARIMSNWYADTLLEFLIVDALDGWGYWMLSEEKEEDQEMPDPFVMLAWRCKKLKALTLIGYSYSAIDLVAIARLRGSGIKQLNIAEVCLEGEDPNVLPSQTFLSNIVMDVSLALDRSWQPIKTFQLHPCIQSNSNKNTDGFVLPIILNDTVVINSSV